MNNTSDVWLNIEEVCSLTNSKKETIRRKCKSGEYQKQVAIKNKEKKILKSYIKTKYNPTNEDIVENLINSLDKVDFKSNVKVSKISNTKMDMVVKEEKNNNSIPAKYVTPIQPKKKLYLTEAEKRRDLEKRAIFISTCLVFRS